MLSNLKNYLLSASVLAFLLPLAAAGQELPIISQLRTGNVTVVHRGDWMNKGGRGYAPEDYYYAFYNAYVEGFQAFEVDTKSLAGGGVAIMHDTSSARTTNLDGHNGNFLNFSQGTVTQPNGSISRYATYPDSTFPLVNSINLDSWSNQITSYKLFNNQGQFIGFSSGNGITLQTLLVWAEQHTPNAVLVLDIQDANTLLECERTVALLNAWNRVVFKVFTQALPVKYNNGVWVNAIPFNKGYYVISINPSNVSSPAGNTALINFYNPLQNTTVPLSYTINSGGPAYDVMHSLRASGEEWLGTESFISAQYPNDPVDAYINNAYHLAAPGDKGAQTWGVVRKYDANWQSCASQPPYDAFNCSRVPNNYYYFGTNSANAYTNDLIQTRQVYGNAKSVRITDLVQ